MADERPQYTTVAKTKNYWMSPQALNITLNARNEANRIAAGVASGARFFCHFKDIGDPQAEALFGYDVGHNFCSWPLIISPTYFYTDDVIYPHIAIPRIDRGNSQAMVVFPTKELDLWGYEVEEVPMQDEDGNYIDDDGNIVDDPEDAATAYVRVKLPGTETDADPVGSDEFYYIYLHGMLTEPFYSGGMLIRQWSPEIDTGRLNTDETWGEAVTLEELAREMKKKVDVDWFKRLFTIHGTNRTKPDEDDNQLYPGEISTGDGEEEDDEEWEGDDTPREVQPNDMEHEITDIEMMFGAWTEQFLSALGKGSGGGGGDAALEDPLLTINNAEMGLPTQNGHTFVWDTSLNGGLGGFKWGKASGGLEGLHLFDGNAEILPQTSGDELTYTLSNNFLSLTNGGTVIDDVFIARPTPISDFTAISDNLVLTFGETKEYFGNKFVSVEWFNKVFETYSGTIKRNVNDSSVIAGTTILDNLKILVGTWTENYVSALGTGSAGGGGAMLNDPLMSINSIDRNPTTVGQTLVWKGANSGINRSGWDFGNAGMDETALANYLSSHNYMNETDLLTYSWWGRQFTANSKVIKGDIENTGNIIPETTNASDIGTSALRYKAVYVNEIYVGDAKISWDSQNQGLHITKGMYSDEWVSALGTGSSGSGGGTPLNALLLSLNNASIVPTGQTNTVLVNNNGTWRWEAYGGGGSSTMSWLDITDKPTTLAGYGITDAVSTAATWWGQQISNGEVTGDITLGSGDALKWKAATGSGTYSMISMDNSGQRKQFILGTLEVPCDTTLTGSTLTLQSGTTAATHSASLAADGVFTVEKLRIGTIVISHDTTHGGLHVESAGLYADTFISALGTGSSGGGSGGSTVYGLSLSSGTLSLVPDGGTQSVNLGNSFVTLSGNQTVSGTKTFAAIHADTVYLGGSDTDCFLNRNGNNLILQNNRSAGTVILAGNANEPTYRKLGSGSSYTDNLILHSGSLNLDGSNNLTGITVGGTTYNISSGGGGGDVVTKIKLTSGGTNLTPSSGIITLPASTASEYGIVKVVNVLSSSPSVNSSTGSAIRNYGVLLRSDGIAFVHVPWEDTDTTNTAGTTVTQSASTYYLIGATDTSGSARTYTQAGVFMKSGSLYSDSKLVATREWVGGQGFLTTSPNSLAVATNISVGGNILPDTTNISDLGSSSKRFANLYVKNVDATTTGETYIKATNNSGSIALEVDNNRGVYDFTSGKTGWLIGRDPTLGNTFLMLGNVGVGTNSPTYKLHVSGSVAMNGLTLGQDGGNGTYAIQTLNADASIKLNAECVGIKGTNDNYNFYVNGTSYFTNQMCIAGTPTAGQSRQTGSKLFVGGNTSDVSIYANGLIYSQNSEVDHSDIRNKNIYSFIDDLTVEGIGMAPVFRFKWKNVNDNRLYAGTSAQYWQNVLPQTVFADDEGWLGMSYGQTALISAVITARKVLTHEEQIAALMGRLDAVEQENKAIKAENAWLRQEVELLKAA